MRNVAVWVRSAVWVGEMQFGERTKGGEMSPKFIYF